MEQPEWVPTPAWERLEIALRGLPADEVLDELEALTAQWDDATRIRLLTAFSAHVAAGRLTTAAVISALSDLLELHD